MKRNNRIVLLDPIDEVVYSRLVRKGAQYHEDASLQDLLCDKGKVALREHAMSRYAGYVEAVLP
jgi:hypothetical protein